MGYWQDRADESRALVDKIEANSFKRLNKLLQTVLKDVQRQIREFDEENANERLTPEQRRNILKALRQTKDYDKRDFYLRALYSENSKLYVIDRLEQLNISVQIQLTKLTRRQQTEIKNTLQQAGRQAYSFYADEFSNSFGVDLQTISMQNIERLANTAWAGSKNWSDRIWADRTKLGYALEDILKKGIAEGISLQKMARDVRIKFKTSNYNAMRLVRTETTHVHEQSALQFYKDTGVHKYEFMAYIDERTSETCTALNGKRFDIDKAEVGVNYPPMHPNCRSTTAPVIDKNTLNEFEEKYGLNE
ncbi:MAG: minor capsid protein [Eubacterium sp.]|nr:minor capsid protein [Eubacterium sp.]